MSLPRANSRASPTLDELTPLRRVAYLRCGKEWVEWDYAVVYVAPRTAPHTEPTRLLFYSPPGLPNAVPLQRSVQFIEQWTYVRGRCLHPIAERSHEWYAARRMAIQVIATYRRRYLARHGQAPHPASLTGGTQYGRPRY